MIQAIRSAPLLFALTLGACDSETPRRPCTSDSDCVRPEHCGPGGTCAAPGPVADGGSCLNGADCASGLCLDRGHGGLCTRACKGPSDCVSGQSCVPGSGRALPATSLEGRLVCQAAGSGQAFLGEACTSDQGCRSGLCEGQACTQPCGGCPGRMVCQQETLARDGTSLLCGLCRTRWLDRIELGAASVASSAATALGFKIDPGVDAFLVYADDKDDLRVALTRLEAPDGAVLVDYASPETALMRAYDSFGTGTAQVPGTDSPRARVQPGAYKLSVRTYQPRLDVMNPVAGTIDAVTVVSRRSGQKGGLLDLDLYFAPATGITAATALGTPYVVEMLAELQSLYRGLLGIGLGEVRGFDLPAEENTLATAEAARGLRKKYGQPGPRGLTVSISLVKSMGFGYQAVAGGVPGVPGLTGRSVSGIVAEVQPSGKTMGRVLAHEMGHYLGLFHTTEAGATMVDKIDDTPSCPAGTPIASCPDRQNLMFPQYLTSADPLTLSAGQIAVVRGSPFLYETVYPEACGPGTEVVDVSASGFASGSTLGSPSRLSGPCGGSGAAERVHLYRVSAPLPKSLEVEVVGQGFEPVVYVVRGDCASATTVPACQAGAAGTAVKLALSSPEPGAYFLVVDGKTGGGSYTLAVNAK